MTSIGAAIAAMFSMQKQHEENANQPPLTAEQEQERAKALEEAKRLLDELIR